MEIIDTKTVIVDIYLKMLNKKKFFLDLQSYKLYE